jgi:hypothetical protein
MERQVARVAVASLVTGRPVPQAPVSEKRAREAVRRERSVINRARRRAMVVRLTLALRASTVIWSAAAANRAEPDRQFHPVLLVSPARKHVTPIQTARFPAQRNARSQANA